MWTLVRQWRRKRVLMRPEAAFPYVLAAEGAQHPPKKPPRSTPAATKPAKAATLNTRRHKISRNLVITRSRYETAATLNTSPRPPQTHTPTKKSGRKVSAGLLIQIIKMQSSKP